MSDARENGDWGKQQTSEAALSARLQRLNEGLGQARGAAGDPSDGSGGQRAATASGYARGFRLSSELVAGVLLGFAAGVLNVMRSAGLIASPAVDEDTRQGSDR